jgi:hypothetical protein
MAGLPEGVNYAWSLEHVRTLRYSHSENSDKPLESRAQSIMTRGKLSTINLITQEKKTMKKIIILLIAAVMLFGVSGQAMAAFSAGDLIQVVYQSGGTSEVATDLGAFSSTTPYTGSTINFTSNPFPVAGTGAFASATSSNLDIAYYIATTNGSVPAYYITGPSTGSSSSGRVFGNLGHLTTLNTAYASIGGAQVTVPQSNTTSYYSLADASGNSIGNWNNFTVGQNGETNLAALSTPGSYVDSYLYYYGTSGTKTGLQVADIRTFADGTSEIVGQAVATPIPAAILLLGSGLAGLVGIRRKQLV